MGKASKSGKTIPYTKVTGSTIKPMGSEGSYTQTGMFMSASGRMTRLTGKAFIITRMDPSTLGIGLRIRSTAMAGKNGSMDHPTKGTP